MKKYSLHVLSLLAGIFLLSACVDEQAIKSSTDVEEGRAVNLSLSFATGDPEIIQTKSALTEGRVSDLYVLLFDENGTRVPVTSENKGYFEHLSGLSGSISFQTTTGKRRIYGIANLKSDATQSLKSSLDNIAEESDLATIPVSLKDNIVSFTGNSFLASGYYTSGKEATNEPEEAELVSIDLNDGGQTVIKDDNGKTIDGSIKLIRLFSNITFSISKIGDKVDSFEPISWKIVNVPVTSSLYKGGSSSSESSDYFPTSVSQRFVNNTFEFAMLENLQSSTDISDKNIREAADKRPSNATYVELKGHFVGTGKREGYQNPAKVDANVTYFISLGMGSDKNSTDLGDYKSKRNKIYVYNIQVAGVDEIITEVKEKSPYHRADSDVTYVEGEVDNYDAHYESSVYTFNIKDIDAYGTDFLVKTPFTTGYIKLSDAKEENDDYAENWQWIHFMVNEKFSGQYSDNKQRYPNESNKFKLMDVKKFSEYLKEKKNYLNNELKVTCFIDEFYYKSKNWTEFVNTEPRVMQIMCNIDSYTHNTNHSSSLREARYTISQKSIQTIYALDSKKTAWGIEWINETDPISADNYGNNTKGDNMNNGYANLLAETQLIGKDWYANGADFSSELKKAYAACMSRNRDENGDTKISKDEMKWYLPAIYQYMDIWMGTFGLPNGFALYQKNGDYDHFYASNKKRILWAEEGSSFGNDNDGSDTGRDYGRSIRCIRNLGMSSEQEAAGTYPDQYYSENNLVFDMSNMNSQSIREQYLEGELDEHVHTDFNGANAPYKKFKFAKDVVPNFTVKVLSSENKRVYATGGETHENKSGYFEQGEGPTGYSPDYTQKFTTGYGWRKKTYYRFYKDEEQEVWKDKTQSQITRTDLTTNMRLGNSPCKYYSEDGDSEGWRVPNQRELQMLIRAEKTGNKTVYSWTSYAFTENRVYMFYENILQLTSPGNPKYANPLLYIRCVKDVK
ncbi:DUF4906 domain-containing protein [Parabacteroides sp. AM58-2XD]|uniref:DUF4906 domain-containing protein n=1 Tax=Parabacteroides TaxID=375288 RepID=UPI000FE1CB01|nr:MULTISPECIES: DUF4906 domain-containing protein [Parabacteroides]RGY94953.1 DUF4906 domain-containing protein [Parabacteroides sp. AM58-2XD]GKG71715.1 DUF4906 domain-containing protein [Parabacteroides goldsteinii]GKG77650.1 DUF4906 domain-containing protein [Parabacteroides goldsteinii]